MFSIGIDLHKEMSYICIINPNGDVILKTSITNNIDTLKTFFEQCPKPFQAAVESTFNWYYFVDILEQYADKVYLANPFELKAFAKRNKKTDKIDAFLIADILHKGYLPVVHIAPQKVRQYRELLRHRIKLIQDRSRSIARIKSLLDRLGYNSDSDFTCLKRLSTIEKYKLPVVYQSSLSHSIDQIRYLRYKSHQVEKEIKNIVSKNKEAQLLLSIPGIGPFSALLLASEIIDINRFRSFNRFCSYGGFAPRVKASANKMVYGPLSKNRCKNIQWILLENVYTYLKYLPDKKEKYESIKKRKNTNTARVSLARDMLKMVYFVLKEQRPFYYNKETVQSAA